MPSRVESALVRVCSKRAIFLLGTAMLVHHSISFWNQFWWVISGQELETAQYQNSDVSVEAEGRFTIFTSHYDLNTTTHTDEAHGIWWAVISSNRTSPARRKNVKDMRQTAPFVEIFPGSWGADKVCLQFLSSHHILISPNYWNGAGFIEEGKVGHWCSFLRFMSACHERPKTNWCVWIEDDVVLDQSDFEHLNTILSNYTNRKVAISAPILRLGPCCDRVNAINPLLVDKLLEIPQKKMIYNPTDLVYSNEGAYAVVAKIGKMLEGSDFAHNSIIRSGFGMVNITQFNDIIRESQLSSGLNMIWTQEKS